MAKEYMVSRAPSLPEDEGYYHAVGVYNSREEAEMAIKQYCDDGYFNEKSFHIVEINVEA